VKSALDCIHPFGIFIEDNGNLAVAVPGALEKGAANEYEMSSLEGLRCVSVDVCM
jgi:hypothetical protein